MTTILATAATIILAIMVVLAVLYRVMIGVAPRVERPAAAALDRAAIAGLEARLMGHVRQLSIAIGERNLDRPAALEAAAAYIEEQLRQIGLAVQHEPYELRAADGGLRTSRNLFVELVGGKQPDEIVVIGAHYDTVWECPGANDNGSGVAALVEIGRHLAERAQVPHRTVRLVAFVNEEPPYFHRGEMGSQLHARRARERGERIVAMLSLETIGYYTDEPGSQRYPAPLDRFYPDTGSFLTVVGNVGSRSLVTGVLRHFMRASDFPIEGAAVPSAVPGVGWSDHRSFWEQGYDAVMLTDTAPFRYAEYHTAGDLPDRLNAPAFARAVHGIFAVARGLAGGE